MAKSTPEQMLATMLANLPEKTGRSLDAWFELLQRQGLEKHGEIVRWLKAENGVTHGFANLISQQYLARTSGPIDLVDAQYAGPKEALKPILDAVLEIARSLGDDVDIAPKKTCVSLRRSKQFALVQPSTRKRVDIGINLRGMQPTARLEESGSFNAMVSHRVRIEKAEQVDNELRGWLQRAYENA